MKNVLVIVEAPGKTDSLRRALKGIGVEAKVMATIGHVANNPDSLVPIALTRDLHETNYAIKPERTRLIDGLRQAALTADKVFLAMDDDQEGDVIAWDVAQALGDYSEKLYRARLRAVSSDELRRAFLGDLSQEFREPANNGTCRRIVDRAIGAAFSEFGTPPVYVGRVQSSLLARLAVERPEIGRFVVEAKLSSGESYQAVLPVTSPADVARYEAFQRQIAAGHGQVLGADEIDRMVSTPWGYEEIIVEASERLGISIDDAAKGFQEAYERGLVSYPRVRSNGFSEDGVEAAIRLARQNRCAFDGASLPRRGDAVGGKVPHESPRPIDDEMVLGRPLTLLDTPEAIAVLVARNVIECGQVAHVKRAQIESDGISAIFTHVAKPPRRPWHDLEREKGYVRYSDDAVLLRYMAKHNLGRPSTIVNHVTKFLKRDLVTLGNDHPFELTPKGHRWRAHAEACGLGPDTSARIEAALEGVIEDPHAKARSILQEHGMYERVLEVIGSDPVSPEEEAEADFVM